MAAASPVDARMKWSASPTPIAFGLRSAPVISKPSSRAARSRPSCGKPQPTTNTGLGDGMLGSLVPGGMIAAAAGCRGARVDAFGDHEDRTRLRLREDARHIFADETERHELHAAHR